VNCVKNANLFGKNANSYLAHPLSFSRRFGPKDLKSWYAQFSCLMFSIKRTVWSSGVARNSKWRIGGLEVLGRSPQPPKARESAVETPSSRRFFAIFHKINEFLCIFRPNYLFEAITLQLKAFEKQSKCTK